MDDLQPNTKAGNADTGLQLQDSENRIAEGQKFKAILSYIVNLRQKRETKIGKG